MRQEAKLSKQFVDAFERFAKSEVCIHKVSDTPVSYGAGDSRQQFSNPRAVDYIGVWRGRGLAIEFKYEKGTSMALSKVRSDQATFLHDYAEAGGLAFICIFWDNRLEPQRLEVFTYTEFYRMQKNINRMSLPAPDKRKAEHYRHADTLPDMWCSDVILRNQRNNVSWDLLAFEKLLESQPEYKREPF